MFKSRVQRGRSYRELQADYHATLTAFAFLLLRPDGATAAMVLTAFRAVLMAHVELLQHDGSERDAVTAAALRWELERIDCELAARGDSRQIAN